jgi:hypothetical protein
MTVLAKAGINLTDQTFSRKCENICSNGFGAREKPAGNDVNRKEILGIRYQATHSEDTEDLLCTAVRNEECELAGTLCCFVAASFKSPINTITNQNPLPCH